MARCRAETPNAVRSKLMGKDVVIENPVINSAAKVATARTLWVPAVNNHGGFGRWDFIEVSDPWDAANAIRNFLRSDWS